MMCFLLACATSSKNISTEGISIEETAETPVEVKELCHFGTKGPSCVGETVQLTGTVPEIIYSHPMLSSPEGVNSVQSYVNIGDRQLIVLSSQAISCSSSIEVTGILREIDMGGEEGTRGSYSNFYIEQSIIRCLP